MFINIDLINSKKQQKIKSKEETSYFFFIPLLYLSEATLKNLMRSCHTTSSIQHKREFVFANIASNSSAAVVHLLEFFYCIPNSHVRVPLCVFASLFFCDLFVLWKASQCLWSDKSAALSKTSTPLLWSVWAVLFVHA